MKGERRKGTRRGAEEDELQFSLGSLADLELVCFSGLGFWVLGLGFWVLGFGFWVLGLGWRVLEKRGANTGPGF